VREDCAKCHTTAAFRGGTFDHRAGTRFPLEGKHEGLVCGKCHTRIDPGMPSLRRIVDFGGLTPECASCHKDQHKSEFGRACDACHRTATFKTANFVHPRAPGFFGGRHAGIACVKCHVRPGTANAGRAAVPPSGPPATPRPSMACSACHADVHLGQLESACDRCHDLNAAKFGPAKFSHDTAAFALDGRHKALPCAKCHATESGVFPAGAGSARRFRPVSRECAACHRDPHLGQVDTRCADCHTAETFRLTSYAHRGLEAIFGVATHDRLPCRSCHKTETAQFPAGRGTAMRLKVGRTCLECHP
jgi:hypothetical protein